MKNTIFALAAFLMLPLAGIAQIKEFITAFTDKDCYLTGEQVMIHVVVTDEAQNLLDMSKVAYVELCDARQMQAQCMVQLKNGEGWAMLELPGSMHSGNYQMNVYTRYLRNYGQESYFKQIVPVVNLLNPSADDDIEFIAASEAEALNIATEDSTNPNAATIIPNAATNVPNAATIKMQLTDKDAYSTRERVRFIMPNVEGKAFTLSVSRRDLSPVHVDFTLSAAKFSTYKTLKYIPELDGHIAIAQSIKSGATIHNSRLSLVGKSPKVFDGQVQNDGTVRFYTTDLFGAMPVCVNAYTAQEDGIPMEFIIPYEVVLPKSLPSLKVIYDDSNLKDRSIAAQIEKSKRDVVLTSIGYSGKNFMGIEPEHFYDLDEWTKFHTVREILIEFIEGTRTRTINKRKLLYIREPGANDYSKWAALVLLDGMPVYDIDALMQYDARRLKYVQIYRGRFQFGENPCQGVISFTSKKGTLQDFALDEGTQMYTYNFPQDKPAFVSPVYDATKTRQPDFRHTLYFDAQVDGDREFYTGDMPGTYDVKLQYLNKQGKMQTVHYSFTVEE